VKALAVVLQLAGAAGLIAFGRWGLRNAAALAPSGLPPDERHRRERSAWRGAVACQVAGVTLAAMNLVLFF
jgi:hypothetical protein